ncbi:MAG: DUF1624 domain-containing protein [Tatlockia sp.]|nr:DUF1624 domain-containing protein [Tatlockia sp.]
MHEKKLSRLLSLDVFRGLTIALMIIVNSPGNQTPYPILKHAEWSGCSLADLVFPFFIFIVGVSTVFSLAKARSSEKKLLMKILARSLIIFFIGLALNAFPSHFNLNSIRLFGVLQRIAICYFFSAILFLKTKVKTQIFILAALLCSYWMLMNLPSFDLSAQGNFAAYIDQIFFSSAHLYGKFYDPEGLLSTIPAIATVILGNFTGIWLVSNVKPPLKRDGMILLGFTALIAGWVWSMWFPLNKALWTSSYVLFTGGLAILTLALLYWLIELKGWLKWSKPFEIFGLNALAAYVLHVLFLKLQMIVIISSQNGVSLNLKSFLTYNLFGWASLENAALFYALSYCLFWLFVFTIFYRKRIFIKI